MNNVLSETLVILMIVLVILVIVAALLFIAILISDIIEQRFKYTVSWYNWKERIEKIKRIFRGEK